MYSLLFALLFGSVEMASDELEDLRKVYMFGFRFWSLNDVLLSTSSMRFALSLRLSFAEFLGRAEPTGEANSRRRSEEMS